MPNSPNLTFSYRTGNTNFLVSAYCSADSKVTFAEKVIQLVCNEADQAQQKPDEQTPSPKDDTAA